MKLKRKRKLYDILTLIAGIGIGIGILVLLLIELAFEIITYFYGN